MKNSTRALTAALAAGLAFGVAAPQSIAKPGGHGLGATAHGSGAHGKSAATKTGLAESTTGHGKSNVAKQQRSAHLAVKAAREAARKQNALARAVKSPRLAHLTDEWAAALAANVAEDQGKLKAFVAALSDQSPTAEAFNDAITGIRAMRPEGYLIVENQLRHAARLLAEIGTAPTTPVPDPNAPTTGADTGTTGSITDPTTPLPDPTDPVTDPADPAALVTSAVAKALAYRADHPKAELRAIQRDLAAAEKALEDTTDDTGTGDIDGTDSTPGTTSAG
jgi:hypothetical protein